MALPAGAFVAPNNGNDSFIDPVTLANPTPQMLLNMSATYIDVNGNRWASNGSQLVQILSSVSGGGNDAFGNGKRLREFLALAQTMRVAWGHGGDSNTGFDGRGWAWYLGSTAMRQFGAFGTGVYNIAQGSTGMYQLAGGGGTRPSAAPPALDQYAPYGLGDGCPSYMYVPSGSSEQIQSYIEALEAGYPHPADFSGALKFRISYGTFTSGSGTIQPACRLDVPPYSDVYVAPSPISTNTGAYGIVDFSATATADSTRKATIALVPAPVNGYVVGPAFLQWMSIVRSDKLTGISFQTFYYRASFSTRDMLAQMIAWGQPALKEWLRQIRLTLTDSGQSRTPFLFSINMGMNDQNIPDGNASLGPNPTTPGSSSAAYKDNLTGVMNLVSAAWAALGASSADLFFLLIPSHPQTYPDQTKLIGYRAAAVELASGNIASVDVTKLIPATDYPGGGLWDVPTGSAHMADAGYSTNSLTLMGALSREFPSTENYQAKLQGYQAFAGQSTGQMRPDFTQGSFCDCGPIAVATQILNPNVTPPAGVRVQVKVTQDATGSRAVTWDTVFKFTTAFTNTSNNANKSTLVEFISDGTSLVSLQPNVWVA